MPDISMCMNDECPLKKICYRWAAYPDDCVQSYADFKFETNEKGETECEHYLKI